MERKHASPRKPRGRGWRRLFGFLLAMLGGGLAGGFIAFASHVDGLEAPRAIPDADGIVVWTGPGGGRLEQAGSLLEAGQGERLLVSGVNRQLSVDRVARLAGVSADKAECCVDIDYAAQDTRGNARETAAWADALGYDHILLVTSAYHMPRARIEIGHEKGRLRITPVAVRSYASADWWRDWPRFKRLSGEYGKFLLSLGQGRDDAQDAHEPVLPEAVIATPDPESDSAPNTGTDRDAPG